MRISFRAWCKQFCVGVASLLASVALLYHVSIGEEIVTVGSDAFYADPSQAVTVVIDAGHGGEDCGAIGVTGVYEKDLNYTIATYLAADLRCAGCNVVETRTSDALLYNPDTVEKGRKKLTDLANRLAIASATPDALVVSIHMNSFPTPSSSGLQVWYAKGDPAARDIAERIQERVRERLQPDNHRQIKETTGAIYLLDRAENPSVLIECGFVTNPAECARLQDPIYQKELSFVIFGAIMEHIEQNL